MKWLSVGSTLRVLAFATLFVSSSASVGIAENGVWGRLVELTMRKGIPVNFKRAAETFALPSRDHEYPAYQIFHESDGTAHHLTAYEDALKVVHLIATNFDRESNAYQLGHGYLVGPDGSLLGAIEGFRAKNNAAVTGQWVWAQTAIPTATASFEREVNYWKKNEDQLETEPDRPTTASWEQKCENNICRWWNGREGKWAD